MSTNMGNINLSYIKINEERTVKLLYTYFNLLRVKQWVKNAFIFMPIVFSGMLLSQEAFLHVTLVFGIFCLLSSGVYILNDLQDIATDKHHPKKKDRPIASGCVSVPRAALISAILTISSLVWAYAVSLSVFIVAFLYLLLHILYSIVLKKQVILDVIAIALGFELRIWAGSVILNITPSVWAQLCVFVLALFLGFIKRRHEKSILYDKAAEHRGVLAHYTAYFLDQMIMISATLCIIFYGLYVLSEEIIRRIGGNHIAYTLPFVVYGIFRYLYLVHVKKLGGEPGEVIFSDIPLTLNMLFWVASVVAIIYTAR